VEFYYYSEWWYCLCDHHFHICKGACSCTNCNSSWANKNCYTSSSLWMVDPEIIAVNPNRQNIFYTCSTWPHTGDDKIKGLLLLYIAKLQVMRETMPPTVIYSNLHTVIVDIVYWQYSWKIWTWNSLPWLMIFLTWSVCFRMYY